MNHYVALDLGAESGRVMLGALASGRLELEEVHRFPTGGVAIDASMRWDVLRFFEEIKVGLRKLAARGITPASLSADSWGVDYAYFRKDEPLLTLPFHYRDARTDGSFASAFKIVGGPEIFEQTGIQHMTINTLYQLLDDKRRRADVMALAERFLNIGDYFNYLLCGVARSEESLASTTQLYDPRQRTWSKKLIQEFGLPEKIFAPVVPSGTVLGPLTPQLLQEANWKNAQVVATCSHDTGAAVAAVPAEGEDWAFLSSGTWSLLGLETKSPVITRDSRDYNFTNEAGLGGTTRLLKNIVGLWIVQECRRDWAATGEDYSYEDLARLAAEAEPLVSLIDPEQEEFYKPGLMPKKVREYCERTGQPVPKTPGAVVRCVYESLALRYEQVLRIAEKITGRRVARLYIVGGGSKSDFFNQLVADAIRRPVAAGPVEATAIGNVLIQALALGHIKSHAELRGIVKDSFPSKIYQPREGAAWTNALAKFEKLNPNNA
jgi:rhamnulokinase